MRKFLFTISLVLWTLPMLANPAYPGKIPYRQPDGSIVYVRQVGDEWYHYAVDERGRVVEKGADGFLVEAEKPSYSEYVEAQVRRSRALAPARAWTPRTDMTMGERHIPVFLIEFQDKKFIEADPLAAFSNLLNQQGYSYNGATGSVRDYYYENSHGQFTPVFDLYGPYLASGNVADYGGDNYATGAANLLFSACRYYDEQIDFSQYDANNDGYVDMMLFYFAGYNQADGGRTYNKETIWPHQSHVQYYVSEARTTYFDGKRLDRYFCTSEFQGYTGSIRCGIGTTCHEFGHSLGLPDFYDTDYDDNGESGGLYNYSLMCSGSRLNNENTPPRMNTEELRLLGWLDSAPPAITETGSYTLHSVGEYEAYLLPASAEGEYFLLEARVKSGWDAYLPSAGLVVSHVDKSPSHSLTFVRNSYTYTRTAQYLWDSWETFNAINLLGSHPLFYIMPAPDPYDLDYSNSMANLPFPGASNTRSLLPTDWDGVGCKYMFSAVTLLSDGVSFEIRDGAVPGIYGRVLNSSAKPIRGVTVSIFDAQAASSAPVRQQKARVFRAQGQTPLQTVVTDIDGSFYFALADREPGKYEVEASCDGYVTETFIVDLQRVMTERDIYLMKTGETPSGDLIRYTPGGKTYGYGYSNAYPDQACAIHFSKAEMGVYQGKQIRSISFNLRGANGSTAAEGDVYVFVEVDGIRLFTQQVSSPKFGASNTVNVINQECIINTPGDTYIGYGIVGSNIAQPLLVTTSTEENVGYIGLFETDKAVSWNTMEIESAYYTPLLSASVGDVVAPDMGFNYIANPGNGVYTAGERFSLTVVETEYDAPQGITWYYDGILTQADSVSLTAGTHQIEARLRFSDGTIERIYLTIQVQ